MHHTFKRLAREPVYLKVSQAIEGDILSGALKEGALLPTEASLCEQFGVTRSSVREGIRLLEQMGLVERGPAKRLIVKSPDSADIAERASRSLAHGGATFREVFEALALFYPQTAALGAGRMDKSALSDLKAVNQRLGEAKSDEEIVEAAVAFFQTLAAGLNNRVLLAMLQSLNMMIGAGLARVVEKTPKARERIARAQKEIIAALGAGEQTRVAEWMTKHIEDLKRGYEVANVDLDARIDLHW